MENNKTHGKMKLSTILLVCVLISAITIGSVIAVLTYESNQISFGPTSVTTPTPSPIPPVNLALSTDYVLPTTTVGTPAQFTVTLSNSGGASTVNCLVYFTITKDSAVSSSDVTLQYYDGANYQTIPLTAKGDTLSGTFGPPGTGFPMTAGYSSTTKMQVTYNVAGTFTGTAIAQSVT